MSFDFKKNLIKVQGGRSYLPVSARIVWFRQEHPDWGIHTEAVEINHEKQFAVFRASIYNEEGRLMATGTKKEDVKGFPDWMEKAECVPTATRILTEQGWKHHTDLQIGELVLAYDVHHRTMEWVPLLAKRVYQNRPVVQISNKKGFDVVCTPDHKWVARRAPNPSEKRWGYQRLKETTALATGEVIVTSAAAPSGQLPVTPQQAFLMGMLITDGSIQYVGKGIRGYICQSKPTVIAEIRERMANVAHSEAITAPYRRTFPTGKTYDCRQSHRWVISSPHLHKLHEAFQIDLESDLPHVVSRLSSEARAEMLKAMMLAEGDSKGGFSQMPGRNSWVIDVWTQLCALEGSMVCKSKILSGASNVWYAVKKKTDAVYVSNLSVQDAGQCDVWCPQTTHGTWVARFDNDVVTITGNTGSVGRALALCGFGTQFSPELDEASAGRFADSPQGGSGRFGGGSNYGGNGGGNSYGGGANRYGAPPQRDSAPQTREAASPRESYEPPSERPAPGRDSVPVQARAETPRAEAPRPQPARPAPMPIHDDGEDDFETLIGGETLDTTEDDPFGDDTPAAPKAAPAPTAKADTVPSGHPACGSCGKALTKAQQELSIRNYGEAFCPTCQREKTRRPALAER